MMKATTLMNELMRSYNEEDPKFASKAMGQINNYFAGLKPASDLDPKRLGSKAVFISNLKRDLLKKVGPLIVEEDKPGVEEFNQLDVKGQIRFQILRQKEFPWLQQEQIVPLNLLGLKLSDTETMELQKIRTGRAKEVLREDMLQIDVGRLFAKLLPYLSDPKAKWYQLASALLLATGRRTIEVMKLGSFHLAKDHDPDGYKCIFDGQAKQKIEQIGAYEIPLLAPFSLVNAALKKLRNLKPTDTMTSEKVNANYGRSINSWLNTNIGLNPHALRGAYAMITHKMLKGKKPSLIGHIAKVLGHVSDNNAIYYQRLDVQNIPELWQAPEEAEELIEAMDQLSLEGWEADGAVEKKRLKDIGDRMSKKLPISARAMRLAYGGTLVLWDRLLSKNKERVDQYNEDLLAEDAAN
jgi:integrase